MEGEGFLLELLVAVIDTQTEDYPKCDLEGVDFLPEHLVAVIDTQTKDYPKCDLEGVDFLPEQLLAVKGLFHDLKYCNLNNCKMIIIIFQM